VVVSAREMHESMFVPSDSALYSVNAGLHSVDLNHVVLAFIFCRILLPVYSAVIAGETYSLPAFAVF